MKIYKLYKDLFLQYCARKFCKTYSRNCYQSIDTLPVWYWNKVHESGNLAYLIRTKQTYIEKKRVGLIRSYALRLVWRKLLDEYISEFGFCENFLDIIRKQKEIVMYRVNKIVNDDKSVNAFIKVCERELAELQKESQGGSFIETKSYIEKGMGFAINPFRCSVSEFYGYVKILSRQNKRTATNSDE